MILGVVSASEIIQELPRLTEAERRAIRVALCNQLALDGALMLDRMESDDARH
jgi:hypothetical protein